MINYTSIKDLTKDSIRVYPGMIAVWPQYNKEEVIEFDVATFNGYYASNNGTLAFVIDDTLYVTRSTRSARKILAEENFVKKHFYVPFSNGDYPKMEEFQWKRIQEKAYRNYEEEFIEDCSKYCDEHGIGTLDANILANCFVMPTTGVHVKHLYYEDTYYPVITTPFMDCKVAECIGTFCTNNGKVVFVYRDGKTYVTKGYKILESLREAGYKEKGLFVPFSNGEEIQEPYLANLWEQIKK